jgi:hypothetical protein
MKENKLIELKEPEKDILDEVEDIMFQEVRFLHSVGAKATNQQLQTVDRIVKGFGVILAVENLKERRYMNRTDRRESVRKSSKE